MIGRRKSAFSRYVRGGARRQTGRTTMASAQRARDFAPAGNLAFYFQKIRSYPLLSHAEEAALARRFRQSGDAAAAEALVNSHLRLVAKVAKSYRGYGLPIEDLIAEGNIGVVQAVRRFDPDRGFRFSTYALCWIRAAIQEYVLHTWSLVKIGTTAAQKKLFFNLRRLKSEMKAIDDGDLDPGQVAWVALELDVRGEDVTMMNRRMARFDQSLNAPIGDDGGGEWLDRIADDRPNPEMVLAEGESLEWRRKFLGGALDRLSPRERYVLTERRLSETPATLQALSDRYRVSRERIRQIELKAFEKLLKSAQANGCEMNA